MSSNIRVFVQWKEPTVFAGEDIECTIIFKNITPPNGPERSPVRSSKLNGFPSSGDRQRKLPPVHSSTTRPSISHNSSFGSQMSPPHLRGHRPALSLHTPSTAADRRSPVQPSGTVNGSVAPRHKHGRSLSIISIGTDPATEVNYDRGAASRRPIRGHGRSASLQVMPGRPSPFAVGSPGHRSATHHSPLMGGASSPPIIHEPTNEFPLPMRPPRRATGISTAPNTSTLPSSPRKASGSISHNFKFPAAPPPNIPSPDPTSSIDVTSSPRVRTPQLRGSSPRPPEEPPPNPTLENLSPVARILSGSSLNGTPRSSGEFYSMSNNSSETLASEYVAQPTARLLPRAIHQRHSSQLAPPNPKKYPETLMMGYAQVMGSFTLDGSLINQAPFEEVKRKGVVGGQGGGGVVGVERTKRDSGLFGALGWGNIGESLGGLLGASEPSSIREMRGIASSKTVPLITTPQSILFVDLRLAPGESRSYTYSFTLPRGLPPTHKGRSMKVAYHLTIGTQRPGSSRDQQVKHVDIPFRVFGSVNSQGEILGHDLMSPYIILRDQARTSTIEPDRSISNGSTAKKPATVPSSNDSAFKDFVDYVDNLLDKPRYNSSLGLLSPTDTIHGRRSIAEEPHNMKEAIDLAILRSNLTSAANQSANRFEIARSGRRVAVIMLARPAYRLGETISAMIDFTNSHIPCYSVHVALETSEKVDPAIALRSNASIYRVTRKVHTSFSENALFAQRLSFSPTIPPNSTPEFITSGVSLEWKLRIQFITPRLTHEDGEEAFWDELLEEISSDDRGIILAAAERLPAESFEVQVPVRVYGAVSGASENTDEEGLAV
ncbi:Rgp1-domain-containing protein [Lindgomyces ingoldianus]|uniref:Rgp1-domain-containing protein n=1 Tax=Lindgomyces ingoldianus TaxID=673940 RepID=A0ACB6QDA6_9PLEO|nr:Rgp1-domain-containing protein [Lindgomyces ingoldianus]KAF2464953.1 Rgp1-domain-containing protein [Lindgomyces ingoldianus]